MMDIMFPSLSLVTLQVVWGIGWALKAALTLCDSLRYCFEAYASRAMVCVKPAVGLVS